MLKKSNPKKAGVAKKKPLAKVVKKLKKTSNNSKKEPVVGAVTHYFAKIRAAAIKIKARLSLGDTVRIKGHTTDFKQKVASMQVDHLPVKSAKKGQEIGLLVDSRVRERDLVYKV